MRDQRPARVPRWKPRSDRIGSRALPPSASAGLAQMLRGVSAVKVAVLVVVFVASGSSNIIRAWRGSGARRGGVLTRLLRAVTKLADRVVARNDEGVQVAFAHPM